MKKSISFLKILPLLLLTICLMNSCEEKTVNDFNFNYDHLMVRIAEIEIDPSYIDEYIAILQEESEASVRLEPGVICIYPMFQKENPAQIRLLEIYANKEAYESHLQTPHFQKYKTSTMKMVRDLKLIDMSAIDPETMPHVFSKLKP